VSVMSEYEIKSRFDEVEMIEISKLYHHPLNPRKDLGDLEELTKSIEKNGIMQNLTVIPGEPCQGIPDGGYFVLIGNRRFEASKAAGLKELPCKIVKGMSTNEQVAVMLEENMQRADLTIVEQAKGFQMMLDFGLSTTDISDKTGFSESTVRHRCKLAELDEDLLKEAVENKQITLTDLQKLEKIESIDKRNELLKRGYLSDYMIEDAVAGEKAKKIESKWMRELQKNYLCDRLPSDAKTWDSTWKVVYTDRDFESADDLQTDGFPEERLYVKVDRYSAQIFIKNEQGEEIEDPVAAEIEELSEKEDAILDSINVIYKAASCKLRNFLKNLVVDTVESWCGELKDEDQALSDAFCLCEDGYKNIDTISVDNYITQAIEDNPGKFKDYTVMTDAEGVEEIDGTLYSFNTIKSEMHGTTKAFIMLIDACLSNEVYGYEIARMEENGEYNELVLDAFEAAGFEGMPDKERDVFTFNDYLYNDYLVTKDKRMKLEGRD